MKIKKILLIGNPNVGKSALFSRLTGAKVIVSNYPGTTVEFTEGIMFVENEKIKIIDVPGTYTLDPVCEAEKIAVKMLDELFNGVQEDGAIAVNVLDSTNLERNLNLTFQLIKRKIPMLAVLNFWDDTKHTGISIDKEKMENILGIPCVPTCAVSGEGIKILVERLQDARVSLFDYDEKEKWNKIGQVIEKIQQVFHRHHTILDRFSEYSVKPFSGILIALTVAFCSFEIIRFIGEWLIGNICEPFFEKMWAPLMLKVSVLLGSEGIAHDILIGKLLEGKIDFGESFGLLTTGLFVPLAAVLPYVFSFYLVLSILEDSGYLPRLAVLMDNAMHKIGLHGYGIIPMILGLGCNVPGALAVRVMETKRERFLASVLMAIAVPCMAQIAMIIGLIGKYGAQGLFAVFGTLFVVWIVLGVFLNKILSGYAPELFIEIPPYRFPYWQALAKKVWMRIIWFIKEAVPWVLFGVFIVNILYVSGIVKFFAKIIQPVVSGIFGLPAEAISALMVGFLRKDLAVGMLVPLHLTLKQLIIASVVLAMYFPCIATFSVLIKEFGIKDMLKATLIMICSTLIVGGVLNLFL